MVFSIKSLENIHFHISLLRQTCELACKICVCWEEFSMELSFLNVQNITHQPSHNLTFHNSRLITITSSPMSSHFLLDCAIHQLKIFNLNGLKCHIVQWLEPSELSCQLGPVWQKSFQLFLSLSNYSAMTTYSGYLMEAYGNHYLFYHQVIVLTLVFI